MLVLSSKTLLPPQNDSWVPSEAEILCTARIHDQIFSCSLAKIIASFLGVYVEGHSDGLPPPPLSVTQSPRERAASRAAGSSLNACTAHCSHGSGSTHSLHRSPSARRRRRAIDSSTLCPRPSIHHLRDLAWGRGSTTTTARGTAGGTEEERERGRAGGRRAARAGRAVPKHAHSSADWAQAEGCGAGCVGGGPGAGGLRPGKLERRRQRRRRGASCTLTATAHAPPPPSLPPCNSQTPPINPPSEGSGFGTREHHHHSPRDSRREG